MPAYQYQTRYALTGDLLAADLPLTDVEFGLALNAAGDLSATLAPRFAHLLPAQLDPGNTVLTAERDNTPLWGGLIWRAEPQGSSYPIEAAGWGSYLHRRHDVHGNLAGREWTEATEWSAGRAVGRIRLGWPRLGARRTDIGFASGINVATTVPVVYDADASAQVVIALGAGEGRTRRRAVDAIRNGRLRLEYVLEAPAEKSNDLLAARARTERIARQILGEVTEIQVIDHPAAPIGSWQIGDDVRISLHDQWSDFDGWCRITGWTIRPPQGDDPERVTLQLARADRFTYGS